MPPLKTSAVRKSTISLNSENSVPKSMATRATKAHSNIGAKKENAKDVGPFPKRKAVSPIKGNTLKRSALGNITNAIETQCVITSGKKPTKKIVSSTVTKPTVSTAAKALPTTTTRASKSSFAQPTTNATKSMLPPLPKSRLTVPAKVPALPSGTKPNVDNGNRRTSVAGKPAVPPKPNTVSDKRANTSRPVTRQSPAAQKKSITTTNPPKVVAKPKGMINAVPTSRRSSGRRSTLESSDGSLYMSALSEVSIQPVAGCALLALRDYTGLDEDEQQQSLSPVSKPKPLVNIDEEYANDPFQCAIYAYDIFEYLKSREERFAINEYIEMQSGLSQHVRAIVVDWMVELQENFELNHETLYLGVKLLDSYLSKVKVSKPCLQLVAVTAMFIASKYDERIPPCIDDFLYVCDGAYKQRDMMKMEVNILKIVNFELGFPLSYRFLRRYARCSKAPMPLLTLARFILEYTLMDYSTITLSDSKMAAAALYLSFKMKKELQWDDTLIYFSGYRVKDFIDVVYKLNASLHQKPRQSLSTVRNKYSHKIFHEVAKVPLVDNADL